MLAQSLLEDIDDLIRRAHRPWLMSVCAILDGIDPDAKVHTLVASLPTTNNGDAMHSLRRIIGESAEELTWKGLSAAFRLGVRISDDMRNRRRAELLWTGPAPGGHVAARRIDQILYDLIGRARREVLLVTFAAHKITRLAGALSEALDRGVTVRLILEFEETSGGQLSMDAIQAFPANIRHSAQILYWPLEKRDRNALGRPAKLHAKAAIVDDELVLSSANLTDDAFNRNLELGVLLRDDELLRQVRAHFDGLCVDNTLRVWREASAI
jgi:phosphatidylserine/phosphatidylglycerophosphate/cardiolipin synthase-like enzyme